MTARHVQCRYTRLDDTRCTAEVVDPTGEILLCSKHLGRAIRLFRAAVATQGAGRG